MTKNRAKPSRATPTVDAILELLEHPQAKKRPTDFSGGALKRCPGVFGDGRVGAAPGRDTSGRVQLMIFGVAQHPMALSLNRCRAILASSKVLEQFAAGATWPSGTRPDALTRVRKLDGVYELEVAGERGRPLRLGRDQTRQLLTIKREIAGFVEFYREAQDSIL